LALVNVGLGVVLGGAGGLEVMIWSSGGEVPMWLCALPV
jgi:hypothetical protein